MTLIFSNNNRLLFNIESSDHLLELSYSNRFTALFNYKKSYKQPSTSYKIYLEKHIRKNLFLASPFSLPLITKTKFCNTLPKIELYSTKKFAKAKLCKKIKSFRNKSFCFEENKKKKFVVEPFCKSLTKSENLSKTAQKSNNFKTVLFDLINNQDTASLALQSFSVSQILSLYGFLNNQPILIQNFLKNYFVLKKTEFYKKKSVLFPNFYCVDKTTETRLYKLLRKQSFVNKVEIDSCKKNSFDFFYKGKVLLNQKKKLIETIFTIEYFVFLKERLTTIKQFFPKTRIWSFAFGSSFLLVSMISILQRQEQNRWLLSFSKSQMPGLSRTSQESSWECFENITLKYLNRPSFGYKYPSNKLFFKQIDCYKDIWYLSFSESWNQQFFHNYTAIFSKFFDKTKLCIFQDPFVAPNLFENSTNQRFVNKQLFFTTLKQENKNKFFYKSPISTCKRCCPHEQKSDKNVKTSIIFRSFFLKKEKRVIPLRVSILPLFNFQFFSLDKDLSLKNKWLFPSWYKMHARIPPKKVQPDLASFADSQNSIGVCKCKALRDTGIGREMSSFSKYKVLSTLQNSAFVHTCTQIFSTKKSWPFIPLSKINNYKRQIDAENDSLPSKMACSTKTKFCKKTENRRLLYSRFLPSEALYFSNLTSNDFAHFLRKEKKQVLLYQKMLKERKQSFLQVSLPHDRLKNLFYDWSNFSIENGAFQENSQENDFLYDSSFSLKKIKNDFEKLMHTNCFSFLQEKNFFKVDTDFSAQHKKKSLCYPLDLLKVNDFQNQSLLSKGERKYRLSPLTPHIARVENNQKTYKKILLLLSKKFSSSICFFPYTEIAKSKKSSYPKRNTTLAKSPEKLSSYFLYKQNNISNRFMSGYQLPEIKKLHFKKLKQPFYFPRISIKVPPALPFYESKIQKWGLSLENIVLPICNAEFFTKKSKNIFTHANQNVSKRNCKSRLLSLPQKENRFFSIKSSDKENLKQNFFEHNNTFFAARDFAWRAKIGKQSIKKSLIQSLKKMPYRQLFLNELQEVKPLFEQVNKSYRISPYYFTFKKKFFTDYNEYLNWSKDTPAAIAITPSVEEDEAIKDSWFTEQSFSKGLKRETLGSSQNPFFVPSTDTKKENEAFPKNKQKVDAGERSFFTENLTPLRKEGNNENNEGITFLNKANSESNKKQKSVKNQSLNFLQEQDEESVSVSPNKMEDNDSVPFMQDETLSASLPIAEDDDKKKEITKFEWLQQVREAEHLIEKRKDFQKLAYPNREALFSKLLQVKPGLIQSLLVRDRKLSFFGIANLFPKRLIAQDQKEISSQILRAEQDRRLISLFDKPSFKNDNIDKIFLSNLDSKKDVLIENFLNSGVLCNLQKTELLYNLQSQTRLDSQKEIQNVALLSSNDKSFCKDSLKNKNFVHKINQRLEIPLNHKEMLSSLRTKPRLAHLIYVGFAENKAKVKEAQLSYADDNQRYGSSKKTLFTFSENANDLQNFNRRDFYNFSSFPKSIILRARQHPIYAPNRRLRLRAPQFSPSFQNNNPQSRIDDLILNQSHRWWQKRRISSSLLGAPSKRYLVMPEITPQDWKKIMEWQLKNYFLEEEKRVEPLITEKNRVENADFSLRGPFIKETQNEELRKIAHLSEKSELHSAKLIETKHFFKIKKIAIYLPWTTLKKSIKKPFEWPLTRLSYQSFCRAANSIFVSKTNFENETILKPSFTTPFDFPKNLLGTTSFIKNRKPEFCFVSSISPHFKTSFFSFSNKIDKSGQSNISANTLTDIGINSLHETSVYKPFLFEPRTKNSYLFLHGLLLAVATKQLFQSIYKLFGKVITHKLKNSSLAIILLPIFFNVTSQKNEISEFSHIKKRLKDLVGSENTISSLSEIVWYLRNSCRGRMIPRGVVLVETLFSESTNYLKAIGGEAQVPVIVQSLRALPFTQNHPQRHLEKILTFAQKRAPCILFLDDLDSIGQSRKLLLKKNYGRAPFSKTETFSFPNLTNQIRVSNKETFEKRKWKKFSSFKNGLSSTKLKTKYKSMGIDTCSSHFRYKPFTKSKLNKKKEILLARTNPRFVTPAFSDNVLQISETERLIEQRRTDLMLRLLTVMDGITHFNGVLIVTTSKNPALLDAALLRPGRFEKLINLELPNKKKRIALLKLETAKIGRTNLMPWEYFGTQTQNMTSIEISSAVNHSAFRAIIQSTVHTFLTLEYGISCVASREALTHNSHVQSENHFQKNCKAQKVENVFLQDNVLPDSTHAPKWQKPYLCYTQERSKWGNKNETFTKQLLKSFVFSDKFLRKQSFVSKYKCKTLYKSLPEGAGGYATKICSCKEICKNKFVLPAQSTNRRFVLFLKRLIVHNPYKAFLNDQFSLCENLRKLQKQLGEHNRFLKKNREISSQIFFYQAGKGIVSSFISNKKRTESKKKSRRTKNAFLTYKYNSKILSKTKLCTFFRYRKKIRKTQAKKNYIDSIPSYFAENIVQLYAGQAAKSLYLDSISSFKNKSFIDLFSQRLFLQSTLLYKEKLQAFSLIESVITNFALNPKRNRCGSNCVTKPYFILLNRKQNQKWRKALVCKSKGKKKLNAKTFVSLKEARFCFPGITKKIVRKYLHCYTNSKQNNSVLFTNSINKNFCWIQKMSETLKIFKRPSGNWYRVYLPKLEQNKSNREWLLPDSFTNQHISLLNQKNFKNSAFVFQYYNIILSGFYVAFQNCSENRELLDLLADHLIRFKIVRLHEIMRLGNLYF